MTCDPALHYSPIGMEEGDGDGVLGHPQTSTARPAVQRQGDAIVGQDHKHHQACQENAEEGRHGVWKGRAPGGTRQRRLNLPSSVYLRGLGAVRVREAGDCQYWHGHN